MGCDALSPMVLDESDEENTAGGGFGGTEGELGGEGGSTEATACEDDFWGTGDQAEEVCGVAYNCLLEHLDTFDTERWMDSAQACLAEDWWWPLGAPCLSCFRTYWGCTITNCSAWCGGGDAEDCTLCEYQHCFVEPPGSGQGFQVCSGIPNHYTCELVSSVLTDAASL